MRGRVIGTIRRAKKTGIARGTFNIEVAGDPWKNRESTKQAEERYRRMEGELRENRLRLMEMLTQTQRLTMEEEVRRQIWLGQNEVEEAREKKMRPPGTQIDHKATRNETDVGIPEDIAMALGWGPKFVFPTDALEPAQVIPCITNMINNKFPPAMGEEAMKFISNNLTKKSRMRDITKQNEWLNLIRGRIKDFFEIHTELIITKSDKGKHTVIMYQDKYNEQMERMLQNEATYQKVACCTQRNIAKNRQMVNKLMKIGVIQEEHRYKYDDTTATTAKIYGLPKIHKPDAPLRPITSTTNSPGSKLAILMTNILNTIYKEDGTHLKNSEEAKNILDGIETEEEEILVSFDVISMFTNIPLDVPKKLIHQKWREIKIGFKIDPELMQELLNFLLVDCATFTFKEQTYRQVQGLAMGSALSPLLARIVMTDLIEKQITTPPKLLKFYVDDTICITKDAEVDKILGKLNAYHGSIQFTVEREHGNKINFLDMTLERRNGRIITDWYKKSYASERMLNYVSSHDWVHIKSTAIAHIKTVINLSDASHFHKNRKHVEERLRLNNFPETRIMELMNTYYTLMRPTRREQHESSTTEYMAIPSISGINCINRKSMRRLTTAKVTIKPDRSNSRIILTNKDKMDMMDTTNVIISAKCNCSKSEVLERTGYKERARSAIERMKAKIKDDDRRCTDTEHRWRHREIEIINGGHTYGEFMEKSRLIAYQRRERVRSCNWGLPHKRMRKHIE